MTYTRGGQIWTLITPETCSLLHAILHYMAEKRLQGVSASDAFTGAVDCIVSSDKRVQKLRAAAQKYKGTDKEKDILASLDLVVSSITSKIVADREAGMALKTGILKKDFIKAQIAGTKNATGAGADSFVVIASTSAYKSQQFESEKLFQNKTPQNRWETGTAIWCPS